MIRAVLLAALVVAALPARADTPGVPPIQPLHPESAPVENPDPAAAAEALRALVSEAAAGPEMAIRPPPPVIDLEPGRNTVVPIARGQLNRLRTPFPRPVLKTASQAETRIEGGVVYVASESPEKITLYLMDEASPDQAMSLTLLPREIPPVDVKLNLRGYEPVAVPVAPAQAETFELEQPYVRTIKTLFRSLAMGEVPQGYGLAQIPGGRHPLMPECRLGSVLVTPAQLLTGHSIMAIVAKVENLTYDEVVTIDEARCGAPNVLAVAAWPRLSLGPGESTELYIAVRRPSQAPTTVRPSVIGGAR